MGTKAKNAHHSRRIRFAGTPTAHDWVFTVHVDAEERGRPPEQSKAAQSRAKQSEAKQSEAKQCNAEQHGAARTEQNDWSADSVKERRILYQLW